jgi:hypothetical protein
MPCPHLLRFTAALNNDQQSIQLEKRSEELCNTQAQHVLPSCVHAIYPLNIPSIALSSSLACLFWGSNARA